MPLHETPPAVSVRTVARARTLTILSRLDRARKRSVLQFLYEARLIGATPIGVSHDKDEQVVQAIVDLSGADLRGIDLQGANLQGANLQGLAFQLQFDTNRSNSGVGGPVQMSVIPFGTDLSSAGL